jgi:peroxiredoxin
MPYLMLLYQAPKALDAILRAKSIETDHGKARIRESSEKVQIISKIRKFFLIFPVGIRYITLGRRAATAPHTPLSEHVSASVIDRRRKKRQSLVGDTLFNGVSRAGSLPRMPESVIPETWRKNMGKLRYACNFILLLTVLPLLSSCATSVKTKVKSDSELALIRSYAVVDVGDLRDSGSVSQSLSTALADRGFEVQKTTITSEGEARNVGLKLGVNGIIYGYVTRIDRRTWVTEGKEEVRIRKTATGTKERVTYDPPKVKSSKNMHIRLKALDGLNGYVIWDAEGNINASGGSDGDYMMQSLVAKMIEQLPPPAAAPPVDLTPSGPESVSVGAEAPDFTTQSVAGDIITLSDYEGKKVVVLNFWGIRCLPCLQEMPKLQDIYKRYKDRGVEMLGVNVDGVDGSVIKKNLRKQIGGVELNVKYPLLLDEQFAIIDSFYLTVAPLTLVIDKQGVIQYMHTDYLPGDEVELEDAVKKVLAQ